LGGSLEEWEQKRNSIPENRQRRQVPRTIQKKDRGLEKEKRGERTSPYEKSKEKSWFKKTPKSQRRKIKKTVVFELHTTGNKKERDEDMKKRG